MKARVKETGEIVEVKNCSDHMFIEKFGKVSGRIFHITELDFNNLEPPDYWTRLEHTYAGMAMQALMSLSEWPEETTDVDVIETASKYAHALVEKMKEE